MKKLSSECESETLHDSRIWLFVERTSLRERLLCESELTLSEAIPVDHAAEETRKYVSEILKSNETIDPLKISKHSKYKS